MLNVLLVVFAGSLATGANDGFRCPDTGRIISHGDFSTQVIRKCRAPDGRARRTEVTRTRERVRRFYPNGIAYEEEVERQTELQIEDWTYDFGPDRFVRFLRFENDKLVSVADGSYGTK